MDIPEKTPTQEAQEKTFTFITEALGFVAGLAWNDAVQAVINKYIQVDENSVLARFLYALGVTLVAVAIMFYLPAIVKRLRK